MQTHQEVRARDLKKGDILILPAENEILTILNSEIKKVTPIKLVKILGITVLSHSKKYVLEVENQDKEELLFLEGFKSIVTIVRNEVEYETSQPADDSVIPESLTREEKTEQVIKKDIFDDLIENEK